MSWYKKVPIQAQIVAGIFLLLAAVAPPTITHFFGKRQLPPVNGNSSNGKEVSRNLDQRVLTINGLTEKPQTGRDARVWFRKSNRVRAMRPEESGFSLEVAPIGIYGFIEPTTFASRTTNRILNLPLTLRRRSFPDLFEVHKLESGSTYILGFVGSDTLLSLRRGDRTSPLRLTLYSDLGSSASEAVALSISHIQDAEYRRIETDSVSIAALDMHFE